MKIEKYILLDSYIRGLLDRRNPRILVPHWKKVFHSIRNMDLF